MCVRMFLLFVRVIVSVGNSARFSQLSNSSKNIWTSMLRNPRMNFLMANKREFICLLVCIFKNGVYFDEKYCFM